MTAQVTGEIDMVIISYGIISTSLYSWKTYGDLMFNVPPAMCCLPPERPEHPDNITTNNITLIIVSPHQLLQHRLHLCYIPLHLNETLLVTSLLIVLGSTSIDKSLTPCVLSE